MGRDSTAIDTAEAAEQFIVESSALAGLKAEALGYAEAMRQRVGLTVEEWAALRPVPIKDCAVALSYLGFNGQLLCQPGASEWVLYADAPIYYSGDTNPRRLIGLFVYHAENRGE